MLQVSEPPSLPPLPPSLGSPFRVFQPFSVHPSTLLPSPQHLAGSDGCFKSCKTSRIRPAMTRSEGSRKSSVCSSLLRSPTIQALSPIIPCSSAFYLFLISLTSTSTADDAPVVAAMLTHLLRIGIQIQYSGLRPPILNLLQLVLVRIHGRNPPLFRHIIQDLLSLLQDLVELEHALIQGYTDQRAGDRKLSPLEDQVRLDLPPGSVLIRGFPQFFQHLNCTRVIPDPEMRIQHTFPCCSNGPSSII